LNDQGEQSGLSNLISRLEACSCVSINSHHKFAAELQSIANAIIAQERQRLQKQTHQSSILKSTKYNTHHSNLPGVLLKELHEVGWKYVESIGSDFTCITLRSLDCSSREHLLQLSLRDVDYPLRPPRVVAVALPVAINAEIENQWGRENMRCLKHVFDSFNDVIRAYEAVFHVSFLLLVLIAISVIVVVMC